MAKRGRPSKYTEKLGKEIERRLAEGETLNSICKTEGMPTESTVRAWALDENHPFYAKYTRARELGYHKMADELFEIADDGSNDWMERETRNGTITVVNDECVQRSRLRVETRKWFLSKALPKIYGDRSEHKHTLDASAAFVQMLQAISPGSGAKLIEGKVA